MRSMIVPGVVAALLIVGTAAYAVDGVGDCKDKRGSSGRRECNDTNDRLLKAAVIALKGVVAEQAKTIKALSSRIDLLEKSKPDLSNLAKLEDVEKAVVGRPFRLVSPQPQDFCLTFEGNNAAPRTPQNCQVGGTPQVWVLRPH